jgi:hypothetical protein
MANIEDQLALLPAMLLRRFARRGRKMNDAAEEKRGYTRRN